MDTSVRVARGMARGRKGRGPRGPIGDADSRSTSGPDPAAEDIRIVTPRNLMLWKWEPKFGKSTGNFITHFKRSHSALWTDALKAERMAGGSQVVDGEETARQQHLDVMVQVSICSLRDL